MFRLLIILLFSFYLNQTNAHEIKSSAAHCDEITETSKNKWSIAKTTYEFLHVINRTKRKDLSFKEINFEQPLSSYSGINIKTNDTSFPICFDFYTRADIVLVEEKDFYDQWAFKTDKHLVFNFHTMINCGSSCVRAEVFTHSINQRTLEQFFWDKTISEAHYPSNWFVDNLTFKEAKAYHVLNDIDLYWRGKWYNIQ